MIFEKKKDIILNIDQIEMDLKVGINKLDNGAKIKKQTKHYNREDRYSYYIEGTNGIVTADRFHDLGVTPNGIVYTIERKKKYEWR